VCAVILIPFAVFKPTAWLAERAIGGTFTIGVKLMVLALIVSLSYDIINSLDLTPITDNNYEVYCAVSLVCVLAYLCWSAPSFAANIISGGPNLTGSHMLAAAAAIGFAADRTASTAVSRSINTVRTAASLGGFSYRAGKFGYNKVTGQGDNNVKGKGGKSDG